MLWQPGASHEASGSLQKALSLVSCLGGVFLATCLLDLLPDYVAVIDEALGSLAHDTPVSPTRVHLSHDILPGPRDGTDHPGLQGAVGATTTGGNKGSAGNSAWWATALARWSRHPTGTWSPGSPSALRACVLVFSLALRSVFEGLAVGLQQDQAQAMELYLALLLHKGILAVSLSLRLLQSHLRVKVVAGCGILFSSMTPLGTGLGAALSELAEPCTSWPISPYWESCLRRWPLLSRGSSRSFCS